MEIKIFTMKGCPHCVTLKNKLQDENIEYTEYDIDKYSEMYDKFSKIVGNEYLPAILVGKTAYVPEKSFKTIDQAVGLIKDHLV